jgi:ankyrin repeat protein
MRLLHWASAGGHVKVVTELIAHGADVNVQNRVITDL